MTQASESYKKARPYAEGVESDFIIRLSDGAHIPKDEGNRDYREFLAWEADGGQILPADE